MGCVASERPTFGMGAGCWFGICTESEERLEPRKGDDVMRFLFHVGRLGLRLGTLGIGGLEGSGWEVDADTGDGLTRAGCCAGGEPLCRPSRRSPHPSSGGLPETKTRLVSRFKSHPCSKAIS